MNEKLLDHLNNKRPVQTASVMQVRKPIYKTSIRRAKNYKEITKKILSKQLILGLHKIKKRKSY